MDLDSDTGMALSSADRALGRLAGAGRNLLNPHLLIQPYVAREALANSRIEGTQASLSDVFDAQARKTSQGPVREVTNYIDALEYGLERLKTLPVSIRLLCEVHAKFLRDVRGQERHPGDLLPDPLLYLSAYFELHRSQYYDRFQAVRERGELKEWLVFFLTGVSEIAVDAVPRSERLTDLREIFRSRLVGDRSQAVAVVDAVLENPVLTTRRVASEQDMTIQGARNVIGRLEEKGIVREAEGIRGRSKRWVCPDVWAVLQPDAEPELFNDPHGRHDETDFGG